MTGTNGVQDAALSLIRQGMQKVPAVKYALGLAAIAACIQAAVTVAGGNIKFLVLGIPITLVLMVVLFLFARLAATNPQFVRVPVQVLVWFTTFAFMFFVGCALSAIAFGQPQQFHEFIFPPIIQAAAKRADITVATVPDTIQIQEGGYQAVSYVFRESNGVAFHVESENTEFKTLGGIGLSDVCQECRVLGGTLSVAGSTTYTFWDNVYLPPEVARRARAEGQQIVQLSTQFNCRDANGNVITVPAVLKIYTLATTANR